jgi:CheY-like chemotaxis protein
MKKILIVEDDFASQLMLEIMIEDFCKSPLIAIDGLEAVRLCKENPDIDFVLMDIKLPELNGYDATKKLGNLTKTRLLSHKLPMPSRGTEK